ncbi:MAG TPA: putative toxin-antitoxin system toxin component, PIN family [Pseudacidobacterium sp.]|nr:putative toxin-antitoxin system toxin component, PIN family [Pseudacidobacterium sp.]
MRAVLDTSVIVAGLRSSNGASYALFHEIYSGNITMLVSPPLFLEYEEVLLRKEHNFSKGYVEESLLWIATFAKPVEIYFTWRPQLPDPSDEIVLETAINGMADAVVTHNMRDFAAAQKDFRLKILRPAELLRMVRV